MNDKKNYAEIIEQFRKHERDSGSVPVQVSLLTEHINKLDEHFKKYSKDLSSKRGLMKMVAKRRKSLEYIKKKNPELYQKLLKQLDIRK